MAGNTTTAAAGNATVDPTATIFPHIPGSAAMGPTRLRIAEQLDQEYCYYSKLVQELVLMLSRPEDRASVPAWVHKLSTPAYNIPYLRDKRNRFMLMLCMCLVMDSIEGPFTYSPPLGTLPDILKIETPQLEAFDWQNDKSWEEQIEAFRNIEPPEGAINWFCPIHRKSCPPENLTNRGIGQALDTQFRYLLYLIKPYAALLIRTADRLRCAQWIQALCRIDSNYCSLGKGVRNDYMICLAGHVTDQNLVGPFEDSPLDRLIPLTDLAKTRPEQPITDPSHPRTAEFFKDLPQPEEGAFAFIAVTGDLYRPKFG